MLGAGVDYLCLQINQAHRGGGPVLWGGAGHRLPPSIIDEDLWAANDAGLRRWTARGYGPNPACRTRSLQSIVRDRAVGRSFELSPLCRRGFKDRVPLPTRRDVKALPDLPNAMPSGISPCVYCWILRSFSPRGVRQNHGCATGALRGGGNRNLVHLRLHLGSLWEVPLRAYQERGGRGTSELIAVEPQLQPPATGRDANGVFLERVAQ